MYEREPWANLSTKVKLAAAGLFTLLIVCDLGAVALGYWLAGWFGATVIATVVIVRLELRCLGRVPDESRR